MKADKRIRVITVGQVKENENMSKLAKLMLKRMAILLKIMVALSVEL